MLWLLLPVCKTSFCRYVLVCRMHWCVAPAPAAAAFTARPSSQHITVATIPSREICVCVFFYKCVYRCIMYTKKNTWIYASADDCPMPTPQYTLRRRKKNNLASRLPTANMDGIHGAVVVCYWGYWILQNQKRMHQFSTKFNDHFVRNCAKPHNARRFMDCCVCCEDANRATVFVCCLV